MNNKTITLYDSLETQFAHQEYINSPEFLECHDAVTPESQEYWDIVSWLCDAELECVTDQLNQLFKDGPCVLTGSIGLWHGSYDAYQVVNSAADIFQRDYSAEFQIEMVGRRVFVRIYHHDGSHTLELRRCAPEFDDDRTDYLKHPASLRRHTRAAIPRELVGKIFLQA